MQGTFIRLDNPSNLSNLRLFIELTFLTQLTYLRKELLDIATPVCESDCFFHHFCLYTLGPELLQQYSIHLLE